MLTTNKESEVKTEITPLKPEDLAILYDGYLSVYSGENKEESARKFIKFVVHELYKAGTAFGWIAKVDGEVAGVLVMRTFLHPYELPELQSWVEMLYVRKRYRRSGVATELVKFLFEFLAVNKVPVCKTNVLPRNAEFNVLLTEMGAKEISRNYEYKVKE